MPAFSRLAVVAALVCLASGINVVPAPGKVLDTPLLTPLQPQALSALEAQLKAASNLRATAIAFAAKDAPQYRHLLRLCNAYASPTNFTVFLEKQELTSEPMAYKECREFEPGMKAGDTLFFKAGGAEVGSFGIAELPGRDAKLLLVIHRNDTIMSTPAIKSHIFENLENPQVAVMDAYTGPKKSTPFIMDAVPTGGDLSGGEKLKYDSVVAVNPGKFTVALKTKGQPVAINNMQADANESYVILRVGVDAMLGTSYPQEILVFPSPPAAPEQSGTVGSTFGLAVLLSVLATIF